MNAAIDISSVRLTTARLILRPFEQKDLTDFNEYARVDGVGQMAGWLPHQSMEESAAILSMFIAEKKTFALELADAHKVVGSLGIEELSFEPDASCAALRGREIGYVLSRDHWGRGLMPEAVKAAMAYCFYGAGCDYLTIAHFDFNTQSRRVIENAALPICGTEKFPRPRANFMPFFTPKCAPDAQVLFHRNGA